MLATRWQVSMAGEKFHGWFGDGTFGSQRVLLLKPTTYMNRSGQAVQSAGRFYKLELDDLLVVSDDLALPTGRLRMRMGGSSGGHNGLQDIIDRVGSDAWCRLRIGIGEPLGAAANYVLSRPGQDEGTIMKAAVQRAADAVEYWIEHGPERTMNRFNGDPPLPQS